MILKLPLPGTYLNMPISNVSNLVNQFCGETLNLDHETIARAGGQDVADNRYQEGNAFYNALLLEIFTLKRKRHPADKSADQTGTDQSGDQATSSSQSASSYSYAPVVMSIVNRNIPSESEVLPRKKLRINLIIPI
jgi:hypothetical protein